MILLEDRQSMVAEIAHAQRGGARLEQAYGIAGIDVGTLQRWRSNDGLATGDRRPHALRPRPAHAL
ncbi:hypothetical protein ACFQS6_11980 [Xanthomonas populi]